MNEKALEICKKYHDKLIIYYQAQIRIGLEMGDIEQLREAHMHQYGNTFSTCCDGPIGNGLRNISSEYIKWLKTQ